MQPGSTIPFLSPLPLSGRPPFASLDVDSAPINPCGFTLLGYILPPPFLGPPPPPCQPRPQAGPFRYRGGYFLQSWSPSILFRSSSSPAPLPPCLLMSSGGFFLCLGSLLHVFESPGRLHSLDISLTPDLLGHAGAVQPPIFSVAVEIYHCVERIGEFSLPHIFSNNIIQVNKYYPGEKLGNYHHKG